MVSVNPSAWQASATRCVIALKPPTILDDSFHELGSVIALEVETRELPLTPGKYELRDKVSPSVRSWIVVEPKSLPVDCGKEGRCGCTHPNLKNEFTIVGLAEGEYKLRGYHDGAPVGKELPIEVRSVPSEQELRDPLQLGNLIAEGLVFLSQDGG